MGQDRNVHSDFMGYGPLVHLPLKIDGIAAEEIRIGWMHSNRS